MFFKYLFYLSVNLNYHITGFICFAYFVKELIMTFVVQLSLVSGGSS